MEYTKTPKQFRDDYNRLFNYNQQHPHNHLKWKSFCCWARDELGIGVRPYQAFAVKEFLLHSENKRVAMCWGRQMGKSILLGLFTLWSCRFNLFPATIQKITIWYIMSRDDKTATELLEKIRGVLRNGDQKTPNYFNSMIAADQPNNTHRITLANGCFIQCVPPTSTILGKSGNVIIDEFAKLKIMSPMTDVKLLHEYVEPVTSETQGWLIISSTPNGQAGEFYEIFDPEDKKKDNPYTRIWFPYWMNKDKPYREFVTKKKHEMTKEGLLKLWQQEYMALFTVTQESFFDPGDIEKGVDNNLTQQYEYKGECIMSIDYGLVTSRTVISIVGAVNDKITLLYQYRSEAQFDDNLLTDDKFSDSVQNLHKRYNIQKIVVDDCPQGARTNKQLEKVGYPVSLFNFRSDQTKGERNRGYYIFRSALHQGRIKYPRIEVMLQEMRNLIETQQKINVVIKAPDGYLCDTIDSFMMACLPYLEEGADFNSYVVTHTPESLRMATNPYLDLEWERMNGR